MYIAPVSPYSDPLSKLGGNQNYKSKDTVRAEKLNFTRMMNERLFAFYNQQGKVDTFEPVTATNEELQHLENRESTRKEIWKQTYAMLQEGNGKSVNNLYDNKVTSDPFGVNAYFKNNPEDWKKVQIGIVPENFTVENTGDRILDIWLPGDGSAVDADFVETTEKNIHKAYAEVHDMFGASLPQLALDTKNYVINKLHGLI